MTRFLIRVGADDDAMVLHRALVAAGRLFSLNSATGEQSVAISGGEAVSHAREALRRFI